MSKENPGCLGVAELTQLKHINIVDIISGLILEPLDMVISGTEVGKKANPVVLGNNPLENILNDRKSRLTAGRCSIKTGESS